MRIMRHCLALLERAWLGNLQSLKEIAVKFDAEVHFPPALRLQDRRIRITVGAILRPLLATLFRRQVTNNNDASDLELDPLTQRRRHLCPLPE